MLDLNLQKSELHVMYTKSLHTRSQARCFYSNYFYCVQFSRIEIMLEYSNVPDKEFKEMIKEFNNCYDDFKELDFKKSISNLKDYIKFIEDPIYIAWLDSINNLINTCVRLKQTKYC